MSDAPMLRSPDADEELERALARALQLSMGFLTSLDDAPVGATASLETLRERLGRPMPEGPVDAEAVVAQLADDVRDGLTRSAGGRFFAWVIGGAVPAALAADWLTSAWDQNAAMFQVAPAASVVEEVVGRWLLELLGLPRDAGFALVTGCQMAHVTCLAAARNEVLARRGWDVEARGLFGAPPIRVITSDQRHGTVVRALRVLGMGSACLVDLPTTESGLEASRLEAALLADPDAPTIVLMQAGDLNTGSFDDFDALIPLAHRHGAWVHVDGAFGAWAAASPAHRSLLDGVERGDSWATDGHKWLNVPYDSGYAFVADRQAHLRALTYLASYLEHSDAARDPLDWTPEFSRRARGFATYAAIASLGRAGIADMVARCCRHATAIVEGASRLPNVEVLCRPTLNQGLVRFCDPSPGAGEPEHARRTEDVVRRIRASGEAFFACTTWRGRRAMRVSVSGHRTSDGDVERTVAAIAAALAD